MTNRSDLIPKTKKLFAHAWVVNTLCNIPKFIESPFQVNTACFSSYVKPMQYFGSKMKIEAIS